MRGGAGAYMRGKKEKKEKLAASRRQPRMSSCRMQNGNYHWRGTEGETLVCSGGLPHPHPHHGGYKNQRLKILQGQKQH